jgi:hypothetical protein
LYKDGGISADELDAVVEGYKQAFDHGQHSTGGMSGRRGGNDDQPGFFQFDMHPFGREGGLALWAKRRRRHTRVQDTDGGRG